MSLLTLFRSALRRTTVTTPRLIPRHESTRYYSSTMHDNDPKVLEEEKHRNLTGQQHKTSTPHDHAPGWNEYLASASEASVKADKSVDGDPIVLTKKTIERMKARRFADTETAGTEAGYEKDEIEGPLKGKGINGKIPK